MQLIGDRVLLRDFAPDDVAPFAQYHADLRFLRFYGPEVRNPEHARSLVEQFISWASQEPRRNFQLAIIDRGTEDLIGCCGLRTVGLPDECADFGLELSADCWGRGLANEAARLLVEFGFRSLGLIEVRGESVTENVRIAKLVRKLGFAAVGARRGREWMNDKGWTLTDWLLTRSVWVAAANNETEATP